MCSQLNFPTKLYCTLSKIQSQTSICVSELESVAFYFQFYLIIINPMVLALLWLTSMHFSSIEYFFRLFIFQRSRYLSITLTQCFVIERRTPFAFSPLYQCSDCSSVESHNKRHVIPFLLFHLLLWLSTTAAVWILFTGCIVYIE